MTATVDLISQILVGRYVGLNELGTGGMSRVWKALDKQTGKPVALVFVVDEQDTQRFIRARTTMHREAEILLYLEHRKVPGVPRLLGYHLDHDPPFLVISYMPGKTLDTLIGKPWPVQAAVAGVLNLCNTLAGVHEADIVHRDIKPGNLILPPSGPAYIIDFDIARMVGESVEAQSVIPHPRGTDSNPLDTDATIDSQGTLRYACLEQVDDHVVDVRCDLYSLAVTVYELLCGRLPEDHTAQKPLPSPHLRNPAVSQELSAVIMGALGPLESRPPTVSQWVADLRHASRL